MGIDQQGFKFQELTIGILAYVDVLILLKESRGKLRDVFRKLKNLIVEVGLQYNEENTAYMVVKRRKSLTFVAIYRY